VLADPNEPAFEALPSGQWRRALRGEVNGQIIFQPLSAGPWTGQFLAHLPISRPWSRLGRLQISAADWQAAWPAVLDGLAGAWTLLKTDRSGDVASGTLRLGGLQIAVVAKRPRRTRRAQGVVDLFRPARARRAWTKTWKLLVRGLPTEIPLGIMERRRGPLVLDNVVIFEHIPGPTLFYIHLDELPAEARHNLFLDVGRTIRRTEALGFDLRDAKTTNWIAYHDGSRLLPVMLDCDGIRHFPRPGSGLARFLRALIRHPHFRASDTQAVCEGYSAGPWPARLKAACERYSIPSDNPAQWHKAPSPPPHRKSAPDVPP
jgi:hypothetical protein